MVPSFAMCWMLGRASQDEIPCMPHGLASRNGDRRVLFTRAGYAVKSICCQNVTRLHYAQEFSPTPVRVHQRNGSPNINGWITKHDLSYDGQCEYRNIGYQLHCHNFAGRMYAPNLAKKKQTHTPHDSSSSPPILLYRFRLTDGL